MECIIFCGIQASGKSTYYKRYLSDTHLRINLDMLVRRSREKAIFESAVLSKTKIVIDNTNTTLKERQKYIPFLKQHRYKIIGYLFESNLDDCLKRNKERIGEKFIPENGIKKFFKRMVPIMYIEGFDEIYNIDTNYQTFIKRRI